MSVFFEELCVQLAIPKNNWSRSQLSIHSLQRQLMECNSSVLKGHYGSMTKGLMTVYTKLEDTQDEAHSPLLREVEQTVWSLV